MGWNIVILLLLRPALESGSYALLNDWDKQRHLLKLKLLHVYTALQMSSDVWLTAGTASRLRTLPSGVESLCSAFSMPCDHLRLRKTLA